MQVGGQADELRSCFHAHYISNVYLNVFMMIDPTKCTTKGVLFVRSIPHVHLLLFLPCHVMDATRFRTISFSPLLFSVNILLVCLSLIHAFLRVPVDAPARCTIHQASFSRTNSCLFSVEAVLKRFWLELLSTRLILISSREAEALEPEVKEPLSPRRPPGAIPCSPYYV